MKPSMWKIPFLVILLSLNVLGQDAIDIYSPVDFILCMIRAALMDVASALAALVFVFAGISYIAAMDDPGKRKAAKDTMIHAIIGLIIIIVADAIINNVSDTVDIWCPA